MLTLKWQGENPHWYSPGIWGTAIVKYPPCPRHCAWNIPWPELSGVCKDSIQLLPPNWTLKCVCLLDWITQEQINRLPWLHTGRKIVGNSFLPHFMAPLNCDVVMLHLFTAWRFRPKPSGKLCSGCQQMCALWPALWLAFSVILRKSVLISGLEFSHQKNKVSVWGIFKIPFPLIVCHSRWRHPLTNSSKSLNTWEECSSSCTDN